MRDTELPEARNSLSQAPPDDEDHEVYFHLFSGANVLTVRTSPLRARMAFGNRLSDAIFLGASVSAEYQTLRRSELPGFDERLA